MDSKGDENCKVADGVSKTTAEHVLENPNSDRIANTNDDGNGNVNDNGDGVEASGTGSNEGRLRQSIRTPFTNLTQEEADLALARTLQEQERAYMMIRMNGDGSDYGSWEGGSYDDFDESHDLEYDEIDEEIGGDDHEDNDDDEIEFDEDDEDDDDAFDVHASHNSEENNEPAGEIDPAAYPDDEAYARALQDAEEREMAARLLAMAGITEHVQIVENHGSETQDAWEDVDPDELSYEELLALGEVAGSESRGLSADTLASLPSTNYKSKVTEDGERESCVICRLDFEEGEPVTLLSCKHSYHSECINNWLKINKVCPVCSAEVSTSGSSK